MSSQYYPPHKSSSNNVKVKLDLANYATKDDVKKVEDKVNEKKKNLFLLEDFFLMNIIVIYFMIAN